MQTSVIIAVFGVIIVFVLMIVFLLSSMRRFGVGEKVIWLREGKIWKISFGGDGILIRRQKKKANPIKNRKTTSGPIGFLYPLTDDLIVFEKIISYTEITELGGMVEMDPFITNNQSERKKIRARIESGEPIPSNTQVHIVNFDSDNTLVVSLSQLLFEDV